MGGHDSPLPRAGAGEEHSDHGTVDTPTTLDFPAVRDGLSLTCNSGFTVAVQKMASLPPSPPCRGGTYS